MTDSASMKRTENTQAFDVNAVRRNFPALDREIKGKPLVYFDNAASKQKPLAVLEAMDTFYRRSYANVHRGLHTLSAEATESYEAVRNKIQTFIRAAHSHEVIFTKGATEAINLVAQAWARTFLQEGDEIILTYMEHHSNIVPWQVLRDQIGVTLKIVPVKEDGSLDFDALEKAFGARTKLVCVTHISNSLGTINNVQKITEYAHDAGARVLVDGCQAAAHLEIDVQEIGCDFYVFSAHKMFGPTGVGVLYGREELLEEMPPYQTGGEMIDDVHFDHTTYAPLPHKFEAGTPPIAEVIGLGAAVDYLMNLDVESRAAHEASLLSYLTHELEGVEGVRLIGTALPKVSIVSFVMDVAHPSDIASIIDNEGVALRAGHHCNQPLMSYFDVPGTARASLTFYNTLEEIDSFIKALDKVRMLCS